MDKEFYNLNLKMTKIQNDENDEEEKYFRHTLPFTEYEQGKLLTRIIDQFGDDIELFNNVRAMIDFKFENETTLFF